MPPPASAMDLPAGASEASGCSADAATEAHKQRRKVQNRKNQRAHQSSEACPVATAVSKKTSRPIQDPEFKFPLSLDHLIHLIHFNVLRALITNKNTLSLCDTLQNSINISPVSCPLHEPDSPCWNSPIVRPFNVDMPSALVPTQLQATRVHPLWINVLPFPRVRDNLIKWAACFDHWTFLQDLLGDHISATPPQRASDNLLKRSDAPPPERQAEKAEEEVPDVDEITAGRRGLIVWGEPHCMESWEATPGFLAKWGWVVEGCDELLQITNPRVKFFWVLDFQSTGEFTEHLLTVYSADEAAIADQIIVNLGLYCLLVECSNVTEDDVLRAEYRSQSQLCQNNAETILSGLPFNLPLTRDCVLALSMAATYMLEICKPSAAWGFIVAASQMSQMLGFHRHALPAALGRVEAKGRSTRIFWVIYITEKMLSLRLGRPSTIRDSDISVQLTPDVLNSDNAVMPVLSKWVHLAQLHGKVYDDIYSFGALTQQENVRVSRTRSLAEDLRKLYHSQSPAEARFLEMRHQALGDSLNELFVRSHRVSYLSLLTLIYRSVPVGRATGNAAFCEECIVTARQALEEHGRCIRLLNEQTDNVVAFYVSWILLASPFVPFTVLFCHVIQTSDTTDLEHLESVVEVLKSMPHDSAETYSKQLRLFKHLYDVACRYIEIKASAQESLPDGSFERLVRESGLRLPIQPPGGDLGTQPADWASGEGFDVDLMLDHSAPGTVRAFGETQEMEFGGVELGDWYAQNHEMLRMMEDDFVGCMDERRA
ncbi:hypothetical protein ACHAQA_000729 [Verticillium albo-atrum]